jgi:hypothetical protein
VRGVGGRAVALTVRPFSGAATAAVHTTIDLERAALERVLDSQQFEQLVSSAVNSERLQRALLKFFESDGAKRIVASFFDSGLFDQFALGVLESQALWDLVDRIAASPAVTAAITQQSLGFAGEVGEEVRARSRSADVWLERLAQRLARRRAGVLPAGAEEPKPATA